MCVRRLGTIVGNGNSWPDGVVIRNVVTLVFLKLKFYLLTTMRKDSVFRYVMLFCSIDISPRIIDEASCLAQLHCKYFVDK